MVGNMYENTKPINPLGGWCGHQCCYCSTNSLRKIYKNVQNKYIGPYRIYPQEFPKFKRFWGQVFVCGQNDLFERNVPSSMIQEIIEYINKHGHPDNVYLFQSKNPMRMLDFVEIVEVKHCYFGTTIETDREDIELSKAPCMMDRIRAIRFLNELGVKTFITIEPIVAFTGGFIDMILSASPDRIYIGADSKGNELPEPTPKMIDDLMVKLYKTDIEIIIKHNINRITNRGTD